MNIITLKNETQFKLIKKFGQKLSCGSLIIIYLQKFSDKAVLSSDNIYYGMKVSKRFSKCAPKRNRAKRRIRVIMHKSLKDTNIRLGSAFIVIPKKNFNEYSFHKALSDTKRLLMNI